MKFIHYAYHKKKFILDLLTLKLSHKKLLIWSQLVAVITSPGCEFMEGGFALRVVLSCGGFDRIKCCFTKRKADGGSLGRFSLNK